MYPDDTPVRDNLRQAHRDTWTQIACPGEFWDAHQRIAMVAEARRSLTCRLCGERKAALSPAGVTGTHDTASSLPEILIDFLHRLRTDPGRLTHSVFRSLVDAGISEEAYVEAVSVVTTSVIVDTLHQALGLALPDLPPARPGAPTGERNADAVDGGAWLPVSAAQQDVSDTGLPTVPNIARALGLVPSAARMFFNTFRPHYALKDIPLSISQAQAEFVASRVSAINQCFY